MAQHSIYLSYSINLLTLSSNPQSEFGLFSFRSPLLGESTFLSIPLVTKMFQFTRFTLSFSGSSRSFLIRVFSDHNSLPTPRNISLVATPFIASEYQGSTISSFLLAIKILGYSGSEPETLPLSGVCSNQLS